MASPSTAVRPPHRTGTPQVPRAHLLETTEPREPRPPRRHGSPLTYYVVLIGVCALALPVAHESIAIELLLTIGAWAVVSMVINPGARGITRGALMVLTLLLALQNFPELDWETRLLGFLNLAVLGSVFWLSPLRKIRAFPFLHYFCLIQFVYVYLVTLVARVPPQQAHLFLSFMRGTGLRLLLVFNTVVLLVGLVLERTLQRVGKPQVADQRCAPGAAMRAAGLFVVVLVANRFASQPGASSALGSISGALWVLESAPLCVLVLLWLDGMLTLSGKALTIAVALVATVAGLGSGALAHAALPGLVVLALLIVKRRTVPWLLLIGALMLALLVNTTKAEFRAETYGTDSALVAANRATGSNSADLGIEWIQLSVESASTTSDLDLSYSAFRFTNADLLGYVGTYVPDRFPYYGSEVYTALPSVFVPRALWPDKPTFSDENAFGRRLELIAGRDLATTITPSPAVEAFSAGGAWLMVVVAGCAGAFLAGLGALFRHRTPTSMIVASLLCFQVFTAVESGIQGFVLMLAFIPIFVPLIHWTCTASFGLRDRPLTLGPSSAGSPRRAVLRR